MFDLWSPASQSFTPDATLTHLQTYQCDGAESSFSFEIQNVKAFLSKRWLTLYKEKKQKMFLTITEMSVRVSAWKKDWSEVAVSGGAFVQSRKRQGENVHQHINLFCTWHFFLLLKCKVCMFFSIFTSWMISVPGKTFTSLETRVHSQKHVVISPSSKCIYRIGKIKCINLSLT